jgi:hypothetical protein
VLLLKLLLLLLLPVPLLQRSVLVQQHRVCHRLLLLLLLLPCRHVERVAKQQPHHCRLRSRLLLQLQLLAVAAAAARHATCVGRQWHAKPYCRTGRRRAAAAAWQVEPRCCRCCHHRLGGGCRQLNAAEPGQEGLVVGRHAHRGAPRVAKELVHGVNR